MSTRSSVAIINKDNSITASYIHHDGYISGVGGPWNSEIDWVGLDKLEHRCGGNPLDYEFVIDALVVVDNIRSRDNDLYLQKEYLSHANELEHFAYKTALENRTKGLFQIGSLIEKADKYFKEVA